MSTRSVWLAVILSAVLVISMFVWSAPPPQLTFRMTEDGQVEVDGAVIGRQDAVAMVEQSMRDDPATTVIIQADPNLAAGSVVELTRQIESTGAGVDVEASVYFGRQ